MKRQLFFTAISLLIATITLNSCSKSNDTKPAEENPPTVANTIWTGEFNYDGGKTQPMTIAFGESGTLTWTEFKSKYGGSWEIKNGILTIGISGAVSFTANISSSNVLTNIKSSDASGRKLVNAAPAGNDDLALEDTKWIAPDVSFKFKADNKVDVYFGASEMPLYSDVKYTRKDRAINFSLIPHYDWFLVVSTNTIIKGLNMAPSDPTLYTLSVTKQ